MSLAGRVMLSIAAARMDPVWNWLVGLYRRCGSEALPQGAESGTYNEHSSGRKASDRASLAVALHWEVVCQRADLYG